MAQEPDDWPREIPSERRSVFEQMPSFDEPVGRPPIAAATSAANVPPALTPPPLTTPGMESLAAEADQGRDPLLVPLLALGGGSLAVILYGYLAIDASPFNVDNDEILFLLSGGWTVGLLLGLAAGLVLINRPTSKRATGGLAIVGGIVNLLGLLKLIMFLADADELPQAVLLLMFSDIGVEILMGAVAIYASVTALTPGDARPTVPVVTLIIAAALSALSGTAMYLVGGLRDADYFFVDAWDPAVIAFASFGPPAGVLLLGAAILLLLQPRRSSLRFWVMLAAAALAVLSLIGITIERGGAMTDYLRLLSFPETGFPAAAMAAIAIAYLSDRPH